MDCFEGLAAVVGETGLAGSAVVRGAADDGEFLLGASGPGGHGAAGGGAEVGEEAFAREVRAGGGEGGGHAVVGVGGEFVELATEGRRVRHLHVGEGCGSHGGQEEGGEEGLHVESFCCDISSFGMICKYREERASGAAVLYLGFGAKGWDIWKVAVPKI